MSTTWSIHDRGRTLERGILTSGFTARSRCAARARLSIARSLSPRLAALLHYIAPRARTSAHLRVIAAFSDFEAYRNLGHSITGTNLAPLPTAAPRRGR